jgi:hypothetical protein
MSEANGSGDGNEQNGHGKVDAVSIFYIFGGIPVIVLYLVVLFGLARSCNVPA